MPYLLLHRFETLLITFILALQLLQLHHEIGINRRRTDRTESRLRQLSSHVTIASIALSLFRYGREIIEQIDGGILHGRLQLHLINVTEENPDEGEIRRGRPEQAIPDVTHRRAWLYRCAVERAGLPPAAAAGAGRGRLYG